MDPASTAVAFVGFAASLTTLAGLAVDSLKTLHKLCETMRDAPTEILRLQQDFRQLQSLLLEIQRQDRENEHSAISPPLCELWSSSSMQMQQDMEKLGIVMSDLDRVIHQKSISSKNARGRVRLFFEEDRVVELRGRLSEHIQVLIMVESRMSSKKLDTLSVRTATLADLAKVNSERVCAKVDSIDLSIQKWHDNQQSTIGNLESHVRAIKSHLELTSFQPAIATYQNISTQRQSKLSTNKIVRSIWNCETQFYKLPVGNFRISIVNEYTQDAVTSSSSQGTKKTRINISFIPPWFLSDTTIHGNLEIFQILQSSLLSSPRITLSLTPISVNHNPILRKALQECDIEKMRDLFTTGQARPTDRVAPSFMLGNRTLTLIETFLDNLRFVDECDDTSSKQKEFLEFLIGQNAPLSIENTLAPTFRTSLRQVYVKYLLTLGNVSFQTTTSWYWEPVTKKRFIENSGSFLSSLVTAMGFEIIPECLFFSNIPWEIQDLTSIDKWLVALLAQMDEKFLHMLRQCLERYVSPFSISGNFRNVDEIIESLFGIDVVTKEVKESHPRIRREFFRIIVTVGKLSMLRLFIEAETDTNGMELGLFLGRFLGYAAAKVNLEIVQFLMDSGANGAWALNPFLERSFSLPTPLFSRMLHVLVQNISPVNINLDTREFSYVLHNLLESDRAWSTYPQAIEILLDNGFFGNEQLYGSKNMSFFCSYLFIAIYNNRPEAIELFLRRGVEVISQIGLIFDCDNYHGYQTVKLCTWLTFAVEYGRAACAKVLIKYGANINSPDGSGRTAIQISHSNASREHPRKAFPDESWTFLIWGERIVSHTQDMETLAVLEQAAAAATLSLEPRKKSPSPFSEDMLNCLVRFNTKYLRRLLPCRRIRAFITYKSLDELRTALRDAFLICLIYSVMYTTLISYHTIFEFSRLIQLSRQFKILPCIFLFTIVVITNMYSRALPVTK